MIKHLMFDLDDTILDFHKAEAIAIAKTFERIGLEPTPELISRYSEINASQWRLLEKGELSREQVLVRRFDLLFEELGAKIPSEMAQKMYEYLLAIGHYFIDGAPELLEELHGKYKLYIVSNGTAPVQDGRIRSAGIAKYFDGIFISEHLGHNKPTKAFFDACFAAIPDFDRSEALIIGDTLSSDILGGINAGVKTVWFNPKGEEASDIVPDYEIKALSELPALLERI